MTDNHHDSSRLVPQHQRIITSSQWVFEKNRDETAASTPAHSSSSGGGSLAGGGSLDHRAQISQAKSKSLSTLPSDREARKKVKEVENMKLQMEYNSARQENDKLKNVISKLKQEIDAYTKMLDERSRLPNGRKLENAPPMSSLLVNSSSKRRKKANAKDTRKERQESVPLQVPREEPKQDLDLSVNPSLAFPQTGLPNIIPTNKIMTNDVMFGALNSDSNTNRSNPGLVDTSNSDTKKQHKSRKDTRKNGSSTDDIGPDDVMLMNTLTNVLSHME